MFALLVWCVWLYLRTIFWAHVCPWISLQGSSVQECQHLVSGYTSRWSPRSVTLSPYTASEFLETYFAVGYWSSLRWSAKSEPQRSHLKLPRNARLQLKTKSCCVVCHLPSALKCWMGWSLSLFSEMPVPACKSSHCQDSLRWDTVLNDAFGQHFHWGKFPLGYSDGIKCGLDVQIKLKP